MSGRDVTAVSGHGICDFCALALPAEWVYPARSFEMPNPGLPGATFMSNGAWAACPACADLIERNDRDGLARRSPTLYAFGLQQELIGRFFVNRESGRQPYTGPAKRYR